MKTEGLGGGGGGVTFEWVREKESEPGEVSFPRQEAAVMQKETSWKQL